MLNTTLEINMQSISASEANRHFSNVLRKVALGEVVTVLSRGKSVATIAPITRTDEGREEARRALVARLRKQQPSGERNWQRGEIYGCGTR
ncbi:type II toxin-antitoxin system prevent-host-death family antitoxin [Rhodocyclus purpureus]|uniref:type II toxin-antitoxin system Phd/YefM family antitoxin n=1 Tax=Rhodocyclus purpureus TaxID=1067 RepID=UPI0030840A06